MKYRIFLLCMLLACASLLACCTQQRPKVDLGIPPTTAEQAITYMDAQMEALQSVRIDITADFVLYVQGTKIRGEQTGVAIEDIGKRKSDYYSYSHTDSEMFIGSQKIDIFSVEAYSDGYAYSAYTQNKKKSKLRAKMSLPAYIEYVSHEQALLDFDFASCANPELTQTDKGYLVTCSGYGEQALKEIAQLTGIADLNGDVLQDMQVSISLDKDYLPDEISLEILIANDRYSKEDSPYFRMEMDFSEYNAAEHITRNIEPEDYTEVKDLRLLHEIEQKIADTVDKKQGGFTREVTQTLTVDGQSDTATQTDTTAEFSNTDKGFSFKAELEVGRPAAYKVTYGGGDLIGLPAPDGSKINRMTDQEAKQQLILLINDPSYGYEISRVTNIEKTRNGYLVTLVPSDTSIVEQMENSLGINLEQESETMEFVLKWGKLVKIVHSFDATGKFNGQEIQYSGCITITFD